MRDLIETIDPWFGFSDLVQDRHYQKEEFDLAAYDLARGFDGRRSFRTGLPPARETAVQKKTGKTIGKPATGI